MHVQRRSAIRPSCRIVHGAASVTTSPLVLPDAALIRDDCTLHILGHHGVSCPGSALRIEMNDVDSWSRELNAKGCKYARPAITEQPLGYREMVISDPAGNRLIFCTPVAKKVPF
jgi:hypothetical protein